MNNVMDQLYPRIHRLRTRYLQAKPFISATRARAVTEIYRRYPGMPTLLLRAMAFRRACQLAPLVIQDDELIISHPAGAARGGEVSPEIAWRWVADELDTMSTRAQDPYEISDEVKRELREDIFPFWQGRSLDEVAETQLRHAGLWEWSTDDGICDLSIKTQNGGGDTCPGYDIILLKKGLGGVADEARAALGGLSPTCPDDQDKQVFYEAVIETCEGVKDYANRYADYAQQLAEQAVDGQRRAELIKLHHLLRRNLVLGVNQLAHRHHGVGIVRHAGPDQARAIIDHRPAVHHIFTLLNTAFYQTGNQWLRGQIPVQFLHHQRGSGGLPDDMA